MDLTVEFPPPTPCASMRGRRRGAGRSDRPLGRHGLDVRSLLGIGGGVLDAHRGSGCYAVTPRDRFTWGGLRREVSHLEQPVGDLERGDRMPGGPGPTRRRTHRGRPAPLLQALDRPARLRVLLDVRSGFAPIRCTTSAMRRSGSGRDDPDRSGSAGRREGRSPLEIRAHGARSDPGGRGDP